MFSLSVVIPSHNGLAHLRRCLPAVCRHAPPGTQVIVADDASTDGTAEGLAADFPRVEVVRLDRNGGFCAAANAGLRHARGEVVELLNNDTEVCPGWADAALRHFADPAIGSVAPLVLQMRRPGVIDSAGQEYHVCGWARARGYNRPLSDEFLQPGEVFGPSGSSGFFRRAALDKTGGLLPEYGAYLEDSDLAFRLRWAGYRCVYEPASRVLHRGSASYGRANERVTRLLARNEEFLFWMNLPLPPMLVGLPAHAAFVAVRAARQLLAGQLTPYLRGKAEALRAWRLIARRRREAHALAPVGHDALRPFLRADTGVLRQGLRWLRAGEIA